MIEVLSAALDAAGLTRAVIGLGDADLYRQLLDELGVADDRRERILEVLATHDLVGLEAEVDELEIGAGERETLLRLPSLRGGPEVLDRARELGGAAVERATQRLAATYEALAARGVAERVSLDLGLLRDLGYYTGAILEVYDPALGPRARRRRALRRADGALRAPAAGGGLRALPGAGAHRPGGGGAAWRERAREAAAEVSGGDAGRAPRRAR